MTQQTTTVHDHEADCDLCRSHVVGPKELFRLTWESRGGPDGIGLADLAPAVAPDHSDVFICADCLRRLRGVPMAEFEKARHTGPLPPKVVKVCEKRPRPGSFLGPKLSEE